MSAPAAGGDQGGDAVLALAAEGAVALVVEVGAAADIVPADPHEVGGAPRALAHRPDLAGLGLDEADPVVVRVRLAPLDGALVVELLEEVVGEVEDVGSGRRHGEASVEGGRVQRGYRGGPTSKARCDPCGAAPTIRAPRADALGSRRAVSELSIADVGYLHRRRRRWAPQASASPAVRRSGGTETGAGGTRPARGGRTRSRKCSRRSSRRRTTSPAK